MDKTQQMKIELENYRASKVIDGSKPDIKTELENYRASKITQAEAPQETPSFGTSVARGLLKTPARLATNLINAGQIALGQEQTQPFSGKLLGEVKPVGTEGTFGQRLKESVGAGLELASYVPVTKGVSGIAKATLGQKALKGAGVGLKEGALGGAMGEFGRATSEGADLEEATVKGLGGGLAGGVLGGAIGGVAPLVAKGLGFKPKINVQEVKDEVVKNTSKALGVFGKKPVKMAQAQPQKMAEGLAVLKKYGGFDPKVSEDIFDDSIKGLIKAKETVFKTYDDIARESGDQGLRIEVSSLTKPLEKYIKGITTSPKRSRAIRIMSELDRNFPDGKATPVQIQEYIKLLNEELGGLAGGAEKGAVGVVSDFVKNTTDTLDNEISKLGSQYKSFRKEYAGLKSIEDALVRQYQKAMRQKGSGLAEYSDMFANAELINGLITANPGLVAKSLTMRGISSLIKRGNNPETYLRKAFEGLDQIGDEMLPKTTRGVPQLQLPAPKKGADTFSPLPMKAPQRTSFEAPAQTIRRVNNEQLMLPEYKGGALGVTIQQPTRKMIQQGTEIVPRNKPNLLKNKQSGFGKPAVLGVSALGTLPFLTSKEEYTKKELPKQTDSYTEKDRGITITDKDVKELTPILFGELSNRSLEKQELEARVILNTALNRVAEFNKRGKNMTLEEVLKMPNQYQAYGGKQYKEFTSNKLDLPTQKKKKATEALVKKLMSEIENGTFRDNTNGAVFYVHKPNGEITFNNKPLFN